MVTFLFRDLQGFNDRKPDSDSDLVAAHKEATEAIKLSNNERIEKYYASGVSESENEEEDDQDKENIKVLFDKTFFGAKRGGYR